jgi:hypothetical protein
MTLRTKHIDHSISYALRLYLDVQVTLPNLVVVVDRLSKVLGVRFFALFFGIFLISRF